MPIRTLEHLKQSAPNDFLRDFIDTAYHWREQPVAAKRKLTGRIETTTEVEVAPEPLPPSVAAPVYWNGVLKRPKVLVDIGEQIGDIGSGALTRLSGSWSLIEYLTQDDGDTRYATRFHAPTHHWDGDDPLSGQQIMDLRVEDRPTWASVRLDPTAPVPPTRRTGEMFWDNDCHCPSFVLEGSDTIWQGPMEDLLYGQNDSGVPHLNGMVGYIKGSQGQRPTIDISRADDRIKSLSVVFATETSIAANNSGYYTSRGPVHDTMTDDMAQGDRMWLQLTGGRGATKPPPGLNTRNVSLGHVIRSHATTGSIFVDINAYPFIDELSGVGISNLKDGHQLAFNGDYWQNQPSRLHRWPINPDLSYNFVLSYSTTNRRPTLTPTGSIFYCWMNGERLTFTGAQPLPQHPNTTGQYFYYVDSAGAFQYGTMGFDLFTTVPICIVEWDAVKGDGWCRPDLHTTEVSSLWHQREHDVDGSEIAARSGFSISGYTYNLDTVAGVTFGISGGILWDEDARSVISALTDGSAYSMFYKSGASGAWTWEEGMTLPYKQGTTYPTVNTYTGGSWTQTEVDGTGGAVYFNTFVVVAPCVNKTQIILVQGQGAFASQALAEAQTWDSMDASLLQWKEFVAIYQVVYKSQAAWSSTTKKTEMAIAKKITKGSGSSGVGASNEHNALTLRDALDAHPSLSITDIYALSVGNILKRVSLGVAAAVPNTDYLPVAGPNFTGTLSKDGSVLIDANRNTYLGPNHRIDAGAATQTNLIFKESTKYWTSFYATNVEAGFRDYNDDGSANSYPIYWTLKSGGLLRLSRVTNMMQGFQINGTLTVDASRNAAFATITGENLTGATTRPTVATAAGLIQAQDASIFRTTIGAAATIHDHTSITGSAAKLTTPRSIGMTGDGLWSVNFDGSSNVSGAMTLASIITAGGPIGSATRTPVITHDAKGRLTVVADALITPAWSNVSARTISANPITRIDSGWYENASPTIANGWPVNGSWWHLFSSTHSNGANYFALQLAADFYSQDFRIRSTNDDGLQAWSTIWTTSNLTGTRNEHNHEGAYVRIGYASDLPNHASRHEYGGADALSGQNISGLRTSDSPTFSSLQLSATGYIDFGSGAGAIGVNGVSEVYIRDVGGSVRVTVSPANTTFSHQIVALSARVANLSTGFVKSDGSGNLTNGPIIAADLPNHASRHEYGGADSLAGQSIAGLRTVDSPEFLNLSLDVALRFTGYSITSYDGDAFYVETSDGWQLIKSTLSEGTIITTGMFPTGNGLECGKSGYRWNFRSNDLNHDCETITASNTTPGSSIQTIPSTGNYFKLTNGSGGSTRNYRIPNAPGSGVGKRLALFSGSSDPDGFTRIYPPSSGQLWNGGTQVTTHIEFNSSAGALKIVMDSDGSNWYI